MAERASPKEPEALAELLMSREEAKARLEDRIQKGRELRQVQISSVGELKAAENEYSKWNSFNVELLNRLFSSDKFANEYSSWGALFMRYHIPSLGEKIADLHKDIDDKIHRLDSIIERLDLIPINSIVATTSPTAPRVETTSKTKTKKVFVVHGHDEVAKTNLEVFLNEIGLQPIVLHR